jgi:aminopeptidase N
MRGFLLAFILFAFSCSHAQDWGCDTKSFEQFHSQPVHAKKSSATDHMDVKYHRLELNIDPYRVGMFGVVTTYFTLERMPLNIVRFDLESNMTVDSVIHHGQNLSFTHEKDVVEIQLPNQLKPGFIDSISVHYSGDPTQSLTRGYEVQLHAGDPDPIPIQWTLSEPYGARAWWPCSQQLKDKVDSVDIIVEVPKSMRSASNGLLIKRWDVTDTTAKEFWRHRHPITTYLIAVAVTNYEEFQQNITLNSGTEVWVQNLMYPESMESSKVYAEELPGMMKLYSDCFGDYPYADEKYGHAQFGRGGGMEHQTMSFMVDLNFGLTAHELVHQWFGNLVTCGSWEDLWLNESFATYFTYYAYEEMKPDEWRTQVNRAREEVMGDAEGSVFATDTLVRNRLFSGRLRYRKGALVLHMLRFELGDSIFFAAITDYLEKRKDIGFANTHHLVESFEQLSGRNLDTFMQQWYFGEGFPVYTLDWSHRNHVIDMDLYQVTNHPSVGLFKMKLPVRIYGTRQDTTIYISVQDNKEHLQLNLNFIPDSVQIDPEWWVLSKNIVVKQQSFKNPELVVYPNPASDELHVISVGNEVSEGRIFDALGREVLSMEFKGDWLPDQVRRFDVSHLQSGAYTIQLMTTDGQRLTTTWIKSSW